MRRTEISAVLAVVLILLSPTRSFAKDKRAVMWVQVDRGVSVSHFRIDDAIAFLNKYTGKTRLVIGRCVNGNARCIEVAYSRSLPNNWWAAGSAPSDEARGFVKIAPKAKGLKQSAARLSLMTHELGHTRTLGHSDSCSSVMYPWVYCGRSGLVAQNFLPSERARLEDQ
jgi:hypothetical protein